MVNHTPAQPATNDIATAPGFLPMPEITARAASRGAQFRHDNTLTPLAPVAGQPTEVWATSGEELPLAGAVLFYTTDGGLPDPASATQAPMEVAGVDWDLHAGYLTRWRGVVPAQPVGATVRYRIGGRPAAPGGAVALALPQVWAHDGQGFGFRLPGAAGITTFAYHVEPTGPALPAWVRDAVIYHIFLDRFGIGGTTQVAADADPQGIHGGTLRGVRDALPYLADLGVTCLWLSPLCASPSYHRYDATDYNAVDPILGSKEDLRALTDAAHAGGMRVLLDFAPSHCSWEHPAFRAAQQDPAADTADWFTFEQRPDRYRCFLGFAPSLPSLNTESPGARAHLVDSAVSWLRDCGIDGFRLDHAIGPGMDFWVRFRAVTRAAAPHVFTVGEITDTPDCLRRYRNRLDAVLDFPLARALRLTFGAGDWSVGRLDAFLDAYSTYMADGPGRVSFLDSHDMNRFLFVAGGDVARLKLAALCQFTLEPTPAIYYGTEVGLSQRQDIAVAPFGGDAEVRRDMPWDQGHWDDNLLTFYRALTRLRLARPALRHGQRRTVYLDAARGLYAYLREHHNDAGDVSRVVVVFNLSAWPQTLTLPADTLLTAATCLLSTGAVPGLRAGGPITLAADTGAALG